MNHIYFIERTSFHKYPVIIGIFFIQSRWLLDGGLCVAYCQSHLQCEKHIIMAPLSEKSKQREFLNYEQFQRKNYIKTIEIITHLIAMHVVY